MKSERDSKTPTPSRRTFLKRAAAMAAAPWIVPAGALGRERHTAPSDRIGLGYIGTGGMGTIHLKVDSARSDCQILAVCDVQRSRREKAKALVEAVYAEQRRGARGVDAYNDFRDVLARPDVDGVIVATLHYWHAVISIMAAQAGKHVYVEKLWAVTLGEAKAMADAAKRHGVAFQHGTQGRSMGGYQRAAELVRCGRIGKVQRAEITCLPAMVVRPGQRGPVGPGISTEKEVPVPADLDWDLYLGPCPWQPYAGHLGVGGLQFGALADFASHTVDGAQMILGMDDNLEPVEIFPGGTGGYAKMTFRYANGMEVSSSPKDPDMELGAFGVRAIASEGAIAAPRENACRVTPLHLERAPLNPDDWHCLPKVADPLIRICSGVVASNTRGSPGDDAGIWDVGTHKANWFHCIRTGQQTNANEDAARRSASLCILADMAYRLGRPLKWDPRNDRIVGDEEAMRLWDYPKRSPWQVY
jgi:hypothetical protein